MGEDNRKRDIIGRLAEERPRLVRLCTWFTGDSEAAEDLVQETMVRAWINLNQLSAPEKLRPWLSGIARNVYLSWRRKKTQERESFLISIDADEDKPMGVDRAENSPELAFDRAELAVLLDQALALLPAQTSQLLIDHYLHHLSHAEIAGRMGLKASTVAVRLQRGKQAFQRLVRAHLEEEALSFDLLARNQSDWEETNIWCPNCGRRRMLGQFKRNTPDARFVLRCPNCQPDPEMISVGLDLTRKVHLNILGSTRMYKPAYKRLLEGLAPLYWQALSHGTASCPSCGKPAQIQVESGEETAGASHQSRIVISISCPSCGWMSNKNLSGLVLALPEAQRFWRENPRMLTLPHQELEVDGVLAYLTRMQSLAGAGELAVISRADTLLPIRIHTNIHLDSHS